MKFLTALAALGLVANGFENAQMFDMDMGMDMEMEMEDTMTTAGCSALKQGQMFRDAKSKVVKIRINGQCHSVTNAATANNLFKNWQAQSPLTAHAEVAQCWEGKPLKNGSILIRGDKKPAVYLLSHQAHHIKNPATFNAFGFDWKKIKVYPQIIVDALPKGEAIGGY